jgi:hypothetical protein
LCHSQHHHGGREGLEEAQANCFPSLSMELSLYFVSGWNA